MLQSVLMLFHFLLWTNLRVVTPLLSSTDLSDITCSSDNTAGVDPASISYEGPDNNIDHSYLCENFKYMFKCCGRIKQWKLYAAKTGTLQLQVWRRTGTNEYTMIGENYCQITAINSVTTCNVAEVEKVLVRKGDFIGWHNKGNETLYYQSAAPSTSTLENLFRRQNIGDPYPGDTFDWSDVEAYNDRYYPLQAIYEASTAPTMSVADMVVPDYIKAGDVVGRFTYSDDDFMDNRSLVVVSTQTSAYYTAHIPSGYVTASSVYRPRDDHLEYYMYDLCYKTTANTRKHAITVQLSNLQFDNLDAVFTVSESETNTQTHLYTITCTDPADQWYCYSGWATTYPFMLKALSNESYGLYLTEHNVLDSATSPLTLTVSCVENRVASQATYQSTITIHILDNQPPTITNLDAAVEVDSETAIIGDSVYNVTHTDGEGDIVTFSMTCVTGGGTNTDTFRMMANGNVVLKKFLTPTTNYHFDCVVTATDADGQTDTGNLHIAVINIDHVIITNLPLNTLQIEENTAIGTSIYTFEYDDTDNVFPDYWSISFDNDYLTQHFYLDPQTGVLSTAFSEINFEDPVIAGLSFTMTLTVGDVKGTISENLAFTIINQNEPPWFEMNYYTIQIGEGPDGTVLTDGSIFTTTLHDEDTQWAGNNEVHRYSLDCDNVTTTERFYMNEDTAEITFASAYDLDTSGTPNEIECTVTVTDYYGLTDTARLYIYITNQNESTPVFTHSSYTFYLASNTLIGTFVGTIRAVDYDSSDDFNNEIIYSLDQTAFGQPLLAIDNDGGLYVMDSLGSYSGTIGPIDALAFNSGTGPTGTAQISIVIPATTTVTTTTTDRNTDFYEDEWSFYWLIAVIVGIALIITVVSLVLFRICRLTRIGPYCYQCCMKGICCRPPPPQPRGFGDKGYDLASFGHRHVYTDEDGDIDGWLQTKRVLNKDKNTAKKAVTDDHARYGTPNFGYDSNPDIRPEPIYEMFRVPSANRVPEAASYQPSRWKDRKPLIP